MDIFGKADVPATNERHGRAVEAIQRLAIQQATGHSDGAVAIDRNWEFQLQSLNNSITPLTYRDCYDRKATTTAY